MVKAVISLYEEATAKIKVACGYSHDIPVKLVYIRSQYCHHFYLQMQLKWLQKNLKKAFFMKFFYADGLVLISDFLEGIGRKFVNWKNSLQSNGLKINCQKTKLIVSGSIKNLPISKTIHAVFLEKRSPQILC